MSKDTAELVKEVVEAAGKHPKVRASGEELANAALTITKAINVALLPLAALNYAYDKAHHYFEQRFPRDIAEKLVEIPAENITQPSASIAGQALQGLAFSHDDAPLREMYLRLLASAMDGRVTSGVHPAFVEIIRQLTSTEANILPPIFDGSDHFAIVQLLQHAVGGGYRVVHSHVMDPSAMPHSISDPLFATYIDNWIRLGLITVAYGYALEEGEYAWVHRPDVTRMKEALEADLPADPRFQPVLTFHRGNVAPTAFGFAFAATVGIGQQPPVDGSAGASSAGAWG